METSLNQRNVGSNIAELTGSTSVKHVVIVSANATIDGFYIKGGTADDGIGAGGGYCVPRIHDWSPAY